MESKTPSVAARGFASPVAAYGTDCTCGARRTLQHNLGCPLRLGEEMAGHHILPRAQRHIDNKPSFENDSKLRKDTPIYSGLLGYFPDACAAVARLSKKANDKHNPGEPMHWARGKSNDHGDCLLRHQMTPEAVDAEFDETHAVHVAWRALAQLQLIEEKRLGRAAISAQRGDVTNA